MTRVAIMQPTYLPWAGYFGLMQSVDLFIILDSVQFAKRSWQQRNQIKTMNGPLWLTVPVSSKGKRDQFYGELKNLGFEFSIPKGTYFMMVPISKHTTLNDVDFAMKLIKEYKVATVPPSAFYLKSTEGEKFLRFCFAKKDETIKSAVQNLNRL
jgi:aspartate/methionine/tyrosine aminotransferase